MLALLLQLRVHNDSNEVKMNSSSKILSLVVLMNLFSFYTFANSRTYTSESFRCSDGYSYDLVLSETLNVENKTLKLLAVCNTGILNNMNSGQVNITTDMKECRKDDSPELRTCAKEFLELNGQEWSDSLTIKHGDEWQVVRTNCFQGPCPSFIERIPPVSEPTLNCFAPPCEREYNNNGSGTDFVSEGVE
jgi:hypothetical protein